jgi:hypothetical protein
MSILRKDLLAYADFRKHPNAWQTLKQMPIMTFEKHNGSLHRISQQFTLPAQNLRCAVPKLS